MHAPHLPERKENLELNDLFSRLRLIFLSVILALFAGLAGALVALGWVWPYAGEGDTWAMSQSRTSLSLKQLEEMVKQEMGSRVVSVYKNSSMIYGTEYFEPENKLANAMIIGSDGWLVMYYPQAIPNYKNWKIVFDDGMVYQIEKVVKDNYADLLYVRVKPLVDKDKQFKIVSFSDKPINSGDEIYVFQDGNWHFSYIKFPVYLDATNSHLDSAPILTYSLNNNFKSGSVVINRQGRIIGIVNDDFTLLPYQAITHIMPSVLSDSKITYPSLQIKGWFSEEMPVRTTDGLTSALVVTKILNTKSPFRLGDIITAIDGQKISANTYYQNISSQENVTVNILRGDKPLELQVIVGTVN